ncbi:hypothetical protein [Methanoculleus horonobensis]|jgi:hypothetical protein|uniref:hypothetical protein n=1 Tax=Methanoculleus horonobensis TaxID=528314 RepID=UPI0008353D1E|nr:hypothetical protein [Methanoculleus horonobensis]MDD4253368.1 hypothetical protein [Methanoculleus horonobensis]
MVNVLPYTFSVPRIYTSADGWASRKKTAVRVRRRYFSLTAPLKPGEEKIIPHDEHIDRMREILS